MCLVVCYLTLLLFDGCLGEAMTGEGMSLMEQLRGESLKFHKPGEMETSVKQHRLISACYQANTGLFNLALQERTTKQRAM